MNQPGRRSRAHSQYATQAAWLAAQLRQLRTQAGLTQEQLAARASLAVATVRKIETGAVIEPGFFTVLALITAAGVGVDARHALIDQLARTAPGYNTPRVAVETAVDSNAPEAFL